jgi:hypothetical protein
MAHAHHTRGFVVLIPESSTYRAKLPPDAAYHLTHTLPKVLGEAAPVVLDYRSVASDDEFYNINHLSSQGRIRMTKRLADALKPYLGSTDSLRSP